MSNIKAILERFDLKVGEVLLELDKVGIIQTKYSIKTNDKNIKTILLASEEEKEILIVCTTFTILKKHFIIYSEIIGKNGFPFIQKSIFYSENNEHTLSIVEAPIITVALDTGEYYYRIIDLDCKDDFYDAEKCSIVKWE